MYRGASGSNSTEAIVKKILVNCLSIAALIWGGDSFLRAQDSSAVPTVLGAFQNASSFSVSPSGTIYVLDRGTNEVLKLSSTGAILARTGGFGWSEFSFSQPADLHAPNDIRVYVADYGNHRVEYFDGNLNYLSSLLMHDNPDPDQRFGYPRSVAMDRYGSLFITDGEDSRIAKIVSAAPNSIDRTFGGVEGGKGSLKFPGRVRVTSSDVVYVQDSTRIVEYDVYGNYLSAYPVMLAGRWHFAASDSGLFFVDSCTVQWWRNDQLLERKLPGACNAVDIENRADSLYILTKADIRIYPLELFRSGPAK
ncbi:MAG TPA: NHL repeat-containing protein [Bacteroidota bacterium]|nr:NHL repeat-containing protein [Bacteroidota bacterium]